MKGVSRSDHVSDTLTPHSPEALVWMVPQPHTGCWERSRPIILRVTTFLQLSIGVSLDAVSLGLTRLALPSTSSLPPSDLRSLTGPHSAGFMNKEAILDRLDS
jgi:hypothetical protein